MFLAYQVVTQTFLYAIDALGPDALICINGPAFVVWMLILLAYVLLLYYGGGFRFEKQCRSRGIWSGPCSAMRAGVAQIAILSLAMYVILLTVEEQWLTQGRLSTLWAMSMGIIYRGVRPEEDNMVNPPTTPTMSRVSRSSDTAETRSV